MSDATNTSAALHNRVVARRRWFNRRDVRFLMFVGLVVAGYQLWGHVTGPTRLTERLSAQLSKGQTRLNVVVKSKFPPEAFHMEIYQQMGSMRGSSGKSATIHRVSPAAVRKLSRYYWIEQIDLAEPPAR